MPASLHVPARLADAIALGQTRTIALPPPATSSAEAEGHEDNPSPPQAIDVPDQGQRKAFRGPASGAASTAANVEFEMPQDSPDSSPSTDAVALSQLSGLGERVRQAVQQDEGQSSPPPSPRTGSIIIYGDVHMPAVQHVQPPQDKTQPPLVRGGDQDQTPQAF